MPIADTRAMLLEACRGGYAVGAFNVTGLVQMEAAVEAAAELRAPLIVQISEKTARFHNAAVLAAAFRALAAGAPVPLGLHLDHCRDAAYCRRCAEAGFTSVMIDASALSLEENIRATRSVSDFCRGRGPIAVEGELGTVAGVEDDIAVAAGGAELCDPAQAERFVAESGVDLFAPAIGTAHGVYRTADPAVDVARFAEIARRINRPRPRVPLVVHGGTGLPPSTVRRLVAAGAAKFNVSTDFKHALVDATFDYIAAHRGEFEPGKIDAAVKAATAARMRRWIELLGGAGKAGA
jgi:ketose-bisphosphate aldolase